MANTGSNTKAAAGAAAKGNGPLTLDNITADQFDGIDIGASAGMYAPLHAKNAKGEVIPLQGILLRTEIRKSPKYGDHTVGIFRLTRPTVCVGADKKAYVQDKGEVGIVFTKKLEELVPLAEHETDVAELRITPTRREELANGNTLQHFSVQPVAVRPRSSIVAFDMDSLKASLGAGPDDAKALNPAS